MAGQEERPTLKVLHVLLDAADEQGVVLVADGFRQHIGGGEEAGLQQIQEEAEVLRVALVGRGGQKEQVGGATREDFPQTVAAGPLQFVAVDVGAHLVRLVHDDQVEVDRGQGGQEVILLGEVHRGDDLHLPLPDVLAIEGVHHPPVYDDKVLLEALLHLPPPLVLEVAWRYDEDTASQVTQFEFLDDQPGHDRLARAGVIGDEEADAGQAQHIAVDRLDLMGQRVHLGGVHRQQWVVKGGEAVAAGLQGQEDLAGRGGEVCLYPGDLQLGQFLAREQLVHVLAGAGGRADQVDIVAQVFYQFDVHRFGPAGALDGVAGLDLGHLFPLCYELRAPKCPPHCSTGALAVGGRCVIIFAPGPPPPWSSPRAP